jgi:hypothetical protein
MHQLNVVVNEHASTRTYSHHIVTVVNELPRFMQQTISSEQKRVRLSEDGTESSRTPRSARSSNRPSASTPRSPRNVEPQSVCITPRKHRRLFNTNMTMIEETTTFDVEIPKVTTDDLIKMKRASIGESDLVRLHSKRVMVRRHTDSLIETSSRKEFLDNQGIL